MDGLPQRIVAVADASGPPVLVIAAGAGAGGRRGGTLLLLRVVAVVVAVVAVGGRRVAADWPVVSVGYGRVVRADRPGQADHPPCKRQRNI